ncbi:secretin N-terminal domain-containing protein [Helicobacter aurati]|nr:secretin N-terminal domain-containing protein [Helicobacter aurati]
MRIFAMMLICFCFPMDGEENQLSQSLIPPHNTQLDSIERYSIIDDLRSAFDVYSVKHVQSSNYATYINGVLPFSNNYLHTRFHINSFDDGNQIQVNTQTNNISAKDSSLQETKNIQGSVKNNVSGDGNASSLRIIPHPIEPPLDIGILSPICKKRKFNLAKTEALDSKAILTQLAQECNFSVQYSANLKQINDASVINAKQQSLDFILKMLLKDIFYEVHPHRLVLQDVDMRIFELNYVSSMRMAQSNTDVLFSQEQNSNYSGYSTNPYHNYNSGYLGNYSGYNFGNYHSTNQNLAPLSPLFTQSIIEGNLLKQQLRNQMNGNVTEFGKSGTKVYSLDESNFWTDIESRLNVLLDIKTGDKFIIDKAAGLVSVWTNKKKMQEVSLLLANIESKMNLQVSLDVEILSLTHFNSSNVGIDWQELFRILNPTQSSFSLSTGGSVFTLQNSSNNLNSLFNFLRTYGNLRSLSNPKIIALNNQPAIISVGSVLRYSQDLVYQSNNANNTIQNTSTQYPSVFAGILLDITPSISNDTIILRINPAITKTKDPELENAAQALQSPPNLSTNQLSSVVKLKDGQRVIIGGLLNNVNQSTTQGIPKISDIRGLKRVFGKAMQLQRSEELIIVITPKIVQ